MEALWVPTQTGWGALFTFSENGDGIIGDYWGVRFKKYTTSADQIEANTVLSFYDQYQVQETLVGYGFDLPLQDDLSRYLKSAEAMRARGLEQIQALEQKVKTTIETHQATICDSGPYLGDGIPPKCTPRSLTPEEETAELAKAETYFSDQNRYGAKITRSCTPHDGSAAQHWTIIQIMLNPYFVIVGTLISAVGALAYLVDTVKGKIKPNRVSFLLWSIAPFIAFAAQIKQGVGIEALMTFSTGFLPLLIFMASFVNKKAEWKITRFDLVCGFLSLLGLTLWLITKIGNVAILFSIVADGLAAVPTLVKSYQYPETELAWSWIASAFGVTLTLLTIRDWSFANSGFIIYILISDALIFSLVQFKIGKKLGFAAINQSK